MLGAQASCLSLHFAVVLNTDCAWCKRKMTCLVRELTTSGGDYGIGLFVILANVIRHLIISAGFYILILCARNHPSFISHAIRISQSLSML